MKRPDSGKRDVVIEVHPEAKNALLKRRRFRIGQNVCWVTKCVTLRQCYRCFAFGHRTHECRAQVRCLKCGQEGHLSYDCECRVGCANCGEKGHMSTNRKCRVYVRELSRCENRFGYV